MTVLSKNSYIGTLLELVKQYYSYTVHWTSIMMPDNVKPETDSDFWTEKVLVMKTVKNTTP